MVVASAGDRGSLIGIDKCREKKAGCVMHTEVEEEEEEEEEEGEESKVPVMFPNGLWRRGACLTFRLKTFLPVGIYVA